YLLLRTCKKFYARNLCRSPRSLLGNCVPEKKHDWTENVYSLRERIAALGERGTFTYYGCSYPIVELLHAARVSKEMKQDVKSLVREWSKKGATKEKVANFLEFLIRSMTYNDYQTINSLAFRNSQ